MTPPITPPQSELDLRELLAKATPGPWEATRAQSGRGLDWFVGVPSGCGHIAIAHVYRRADRHPGKEEANAALIVAAVNSLPALLDENARLRSALTPSAETKAAYMGEFSVPLPEIDENGDEYLRQINVPWTTIKKIMAAIRALAALHPKEQTDDTR